MKKDEIYAEVKKNEYIRDGQHIVLGLSGGPDSVCLFNILLELKDEIDIAVYPVHVNHMIRGDAANSDMMYCRKLCEDNGIDCSVFSFDCVKTAKKLGIATEEAGRLKRYECFGSVAGEIEATGVPREYISVATAHNADDQVETIIFRVLRGTGIDGLAGMREVRKSDDGFTVIKPLLGVRKKDIVAYCEEKSLNPCIDYTNDEPVYDRNRIRLELIPYLERYNPNVSEAILRLGKAAAEDSDFLQAMALRTDAPTDAGDSAVSDGMSDTADMSAQDVPGDAIAAAKPYEISCGNIFENAPSLWKRSVAGILRRLGLSEDLQAGHFDEMEKLAGSRLPSAAVNLPRGYTVRKSYDRIIFSRPGRPAGRPPQMSCRSVDKGECGSRIKNGMHAEFDEDLLVERFGRDFRNAICVRPRKPGDYIVLKGGSGRKKIQNLFVDEKVPKEKRAEIYMVAIGSEILFIPAAGDVFDRGRYSGLYPVSKDTKKTFCIEILSFV